MVKLADNRRRSQCGALMTELMVAMALLAGALLPLAYSIAKERQLARATYQRAVAMELVDGEMEILAAGGWRTFAGGRQLYRVNAVAVTNLPAGDFWLTLDSGKVQLEWKPTVKDHGGSVVREVMAK
jgi:Tfp pilus assembly protein PilV